MGRRKGPKPDRLIIASVHGIVARHVQQAGECLNAAQRAAAVAEIQHETTRPDLLAEVAGIMLGARGDRVAHDLLVEAGADETLIPAWAEEGERRARAPRHSAP